MDVLSRTAAGLRCPYCHDDLHGPVIRCVRCGTASHAVCAHEDPRCTVLGCRGLLTHTRSEELARFFWRVPRWREALSWGGDRARLVPRVVRGARGALGRALARLIDVLRAPSRLASARVHARLARARARRALVAAIEVEWTARLRALEDAAAEARDRAPADPIARASLLWLGGGRPSPAVSAILAHARAERRLGAAEAERDEEQRRARFAPFDEVERARARRLARWARDAATASRRGGA